MVLISVEHAEPRIEGYLSRHMLKVRPGVFTGRLSKTRRDLLWQHIIEEQPDIDAVMCFDTANNTIELQTNGDPKRKVVDVDGVPLLAFPRPEHWKKLLAKPEKLLWEHSVETAIMAKAFLTESNYAIDLDKMYEETDKPISKEKFLDSILFVIALHDLGKLHPYFQENLLSTPTNTDFRFGFRHEQESARQLGIFLRKNTTSTLRIKRSLPAIVAEHHQGKGESIYKDQAEAEADNSTVYHNDVRDMINFIDSLWHFTPFDITGRANVFCQLLAGILRFSDWAASSYYKDLHSEEDDYIGKCYAKARQFLYAGYLIREPIPPMKYDYTNLCDLTQDQLYPLQKKLIQVMKEHPMAECVLIEDQPGSGKTEGAFYTAVQLMQSYGYNSIYVALPTDATASEMLPRLKKCFQEHGLFSDVDPRLLTGKAWLHEDDASSDEEDSKIEWETKSRKLFSPFACGTVDQMMQVSIRMKAGDMRLLAVSNKVVIIDEFHAYLGYMMGILEPMLEWFHALHVPVIILSATLLKETRKEIFSIYSDDIPESVGYPRITCAERGHTYSYQCEAAKKKTYSFTTIQHTDAIKAVIKSVETGGDTLCVVNTVKKAWNTYQALRSVADEDIRIRLYTGRTDPSNKDILGEEMVYLYGKQGKKEGKRPSKTIVVSTQITEMSLDVDFDTVFSELAPADALLQRMGRMARHDDNGTVRESGFKSVFYLVIPEKEGGEWNLPYSKSVLEGTEKAFFGYTKITTPTDSEILLEESYSNAGSAWVEEAKEAAARSDFKAIPGPLEKYMAYKPVLDTSTREEKYKTVTLLCIPEGEAIQDTKEWTRKMVLTHSVPIPKYIADKIDPLEDTSDTKWLRVYKIVTDEPDFWGPDKQFIFGL